MYCVALLSNHSFIATIVFVHGMLYMEGCIASKCNVLNENDLLLNNAGNLTRSLQILHLSVFPQQQLFTYI